MQTTVVKPHGWVFKALWECRIVKKYFTEIFNKISNLMKYYCLGNHASTRRPNSAVPPRYPWGAGSLWGTASRWCGALRSNSLFYVELLLSIKIPDDSHIIASIGEVEKSRTEGHRLNTPPTARQVWAGLGHDVRYTHALHPAQILLLVPFYDTQWIWWFMPVLPQANRRN